MDNLDYCIEDDLDKTKILDKISDAVDGELQAYSECKDATQDVDSHAFGLLEGRKEFAEQLWNIIYNKENI